MIVTNYIEWKRVNENEDEEFDFNDIDLDNLDLGDFAGASDEDEGMMDTMGYNINILPELSELKAGGIGGVSRSVPQFFKDVSSFQAPSELFDPYEGKVFDDLLTWFTNIKNGNRHSKLKASDMDLDDPGAMTKHLIMYGSLYEKSIKNNDTPVIIVFQGEAWEVYHTDSYISQIWCLFVNTAIKIKSKHILHVDEYEHGWSHSGVAIIKQSGMERDVIEHFKKTGVTVDDAINLMSDYIRIDRDKLDVTEITEKLNTIL